MTHPTWTERRRHLGDRPYPVAALAVAMGLDPDDPHLTSRLVTTLGLERSWVRRCRQVGLSARSADHWAARAGLHADIVWPGWWDDPTDTDPIDGEDDPPLNELQPVSPERLAQLRAWRQDAAA